MPKFEVQAKGLAKAEPFQGSMCFAQKVSVELFSVQPLCSLCLCG